MLCRRNSTPVILCLATPVIRTSRRAVCSCLGPLDGSPCDTLGLDKRPVARYLGVSAADNPVLQDQVQVWPNPVRDRLAVTLNVNLRSPVFRLYDQLGGLLREERLALVWSEIGTEDLPPGIYFYGIEARGERVTVEKLVKLD